MSEVNWTQVRRAAEEARIETSCMHGTSCHDVLCVERQARGECLATATEVLADIGPVLDAWCDEVWGPDWRTSMAAGGCGMSDVYRDRLRAVWTTVRAKLGGG